MADKRNRLTSPLRPERLYRHLAGIYDLWSVVVRRVVYRRAHKALDASISAFLPPGGGKVLDLGCGTGENLDRILKIHGKPELYVGMDFSGPMLERASQKYSSLVDSKFILADLENAPLPEGQFDLVICTWVLPLLARPEDLVQRCLKSLSADGHLVVLFTARSGTPADLLVVPLWGLFGARPLRSEVPSRFGGGVEVRRFALGTLVLAVLGRNS